MAGWRDARPVGRQVGLAAAAGEGGGAASFSGSATRACTVRAPRAMTWIARPRRQVAGVLGALCIHSGAFMEPAEPIRQFHLAKKRYGRVRWILDDINLP